MSSGDAQRLLPAKLKWQSHDTTYVRPVAVEHPALRELAGVADSAPWSEFPVFKYWELEPGAEPAEVIATFANGKPAIVERQIGAGRVRNDDDVDFGLCVGRCLELVADGARSLAVHRTGKWHCEIFKRHRPVAIELSGGSNSCAATCGE